MTAEALFYGTLDVGVRLAITGIAQHGGPSTWDIDQARAVSEALGPQVGPLLYGGSAGVELVAHLIPALAILAFCPGGVRMGPCHWQEERR